MGLFIESNLRTRAIRQRSANKSTNAVLLEKVQASTQLNQFDIFLSHSISDQELILGIWYSLEDLGYKVYVDWINDPLLSRDSVSKKTADALRLRMSQSKCLFFATSANSSTSKWMPWELGFMDGHNRRAAILPVSNTTANTYSGQEYLGIYPYVTQDKAEGESKDSLWINASISSYVKFDLWLTGLNPYPH